MMRLRSLCRPLALASLLLACVVGVAVAAAPADGPWRLRLELSSFFDGPLGTVERVIELREGRWQGNIRQDGIVVGLRLAIADGAVDGHMAVRAGYDFYAVSIPFTAAVADGAVERRLSGEATMRLGQDLNDRETRGVDIRLRLERH